MKIAPLYNPKTIAKRCADVSITAKQKKAAKEWLSLLKENKLEKEVSNYRNFMDIILRDLLGCPEKELRKGYEEKNVEFSFKDKDGNTAVCFEAKGTDTKDLFARQRYGRKDQETPVIQTYTNMGRFPAAYGVCTNYKDFILLDAKHGLTKCHQFNFTGIENNENRLKEFLSIFSYENLVLKKTLESLYLASVTEEREFTKEFYKLFHETRLMLIEAFREKEDVSLEQAIHYSQLFLNRLIFIFFAEDQNFLENRLFTNRVLQKLDRGECNEFSKEVSDSIQNLFKILDKGSDIEGVFGFDGGLFKESIPPKIFFYDLKDPEFFKKVKQYSKLSKSIPLDEVSLKIIKKYKGKLNPIISNLIIMDSFNFTSQVNVYILGHIFEQSISDLEELIEKKITRRKKEGVYYTPEFVTDYICSNTIIPYLSKNNSTTVHQLISEYSENLDELEKKIRNVKILDLACGSGAFLLKAVEILIEVDDGIQNMKPSTGEQKQLVTWSAEKEIIKIIENNIFGVDINEESVEITKLSLFLKMAGVNRKLSDLSKNIRIGNSIVDEKKFDTRAFNWENEFPEIFKQGGFDIVIGNPPYVRHEFLAGIKEHLEKNYSVYHGGADLYVYFIEKGISLLKNNGRFSIIVSNKFSKISYGKKLRNFLLKYNIEKFIDFGDLRVFEDVSTYPCILTVTKSSPTDYLHACNVNTLNFIELESYLKKQIKKIPISSLGKSAWNISGVDSQRILQKLSKNTQSFGDLTDHKFFSGIKTGLNKAFIISNKVREKLIVDNPESAEIIYPYLTGKEIKRYRIEWENHYMIFTRRGIDITKYPAIEKYLNSFREELEPKRSSKDKKGRKPGNYEWYEIQDTIDYWQVFCESGIVYPHFNKHCNFTITTSPFFPNTKGYHLQSLEYWLLALLNSKVINFYLNSICPFVKGGYYEYRSYNVETIPISLNEEYRPKLSTFAKQMLENHKKILDNKEKMKNRVQLELSIEKFTGKLEKFYEMEFYEFLKEIYKKTKKRLSLKEQDEWEEYFEDKKKLISGLKDENNLINQKIDSIVYQMYELNDDEIKIIENSLK